MSFAHKLPTFNINILGLMLSSLLLGWQTFTTANAAEPNANLPLSETKLPDADITNNTVPWSKTPADAWPVFRGNSLGTGVASGPLPDNLELLWKHSVPKGAFDTTAAIVEGVAYLGDLDGTVYAFRLTNGEVLWKKQLSEIGFSAPVAARDGLVYFGDQDGMFFAMHAKNGEIAWKFEAGGQLHGANFYQDRVLVGGRNGKLHCLKAATGEVVWTFSTQDEIRCTPTVVAGHAFLVGCDQQLHVIDLNTGKSARDIDLKVPAGSTAAAAGEVIFFGTSSGEFLSLNWQRGETLWTFQDKVRQQPISGSAALTTEAVIVPGEDKTLRALQPANGEEIWKLTLRGKLEGSPVVAGNRVIVAGIDGRITAVNRSTGKKEWEYEAGGRFPGSPAVAAGKLVIANDDGNVYCFGAK